MKLGDQKTTSRAFTAHDVEDYIALGGSKPVDSTVPEPLIGGLFSYLLGVELPGPGTMYLKQETDFIAPARVGDTLTAKVEVTQLRPEKKLIDLRTSCRDGDGALVADGRALVYLDAPHWPVKA